MPKTVENSARPFIKELITSPLRAIMPKQTTADVKPPEGRPYNKNDRSIDPGEIKLEKWKPWERYLEARKFDRSMLHL